MKIIKRFLHRVVSKMFLLYHNLFNECSISYSVTINNFKNVTFGRGVKIESNVSVNTKQGKISIGPKVVIEQNSQLNSPTGFIEISAGVKIESFCTITNNGNSISIGKSSVLGFNTELKSFEGGVMLIKDNVIFSKNCKVWANGGYVTIGANSSFKQGIDLQSNLGYINIGDRLKIHNYSILYGNGGLDIHNDVRIAAHCVIVSSNYNIDGEIELKNEQAINKGITIKDYAWIAANCNILDGVVIGKGACIGAGSLVSRSVPDFFLSYGVPNKNIRARKIEQK